jgi:hypothetical protein
LGFFIKTVVLDPFAFRQELLTPFAQGPGVVNVSPSTTMKDEHLVLPFDKIRREAIAPGKKGVFGRSRSLT